MNSDELDLANVVYDEMPVPPSFGYFKRTVEDVIARRLTPAEAQEAYMLCSKDW